MPVTNRIAEIRQLLEDASGPQAHVGREWPGTLAKWSPYEQWLDRSVDSANFLLSEIDRLLDGAAQD